VKRAWQQKLNLYSKSRAQKKYLFEPQNPEETPTFAVLSQESSNGDWFLQVENNHLRVSKNNIYETYISATQSQT